MSRKYVSAVNFLESNVEDFIGKLRVLELVVCIRAVSGVQIVTFFGF